MRKFAFVAAVCLLLSACTTTSTKLAFQTQAKPPAGTRVLLVQPDVQLALLTAAGLLEPRADWSSQARSNLALQIEQDIKQRAHAYSIVDPDTAMTGRVGQLLRLNQAVGGSILQYSYGMPLPTKKGGFDWTVGAGAQEVGAAYQADYALFVTGSGTYASGGRVAAAVGMSLLGVSVPLGHQQAFASLVDLKTGQVVWFNVAHAGPDADMRETRGSDLLVAALLKDVPL